VRAKQRRDFWKSFLPPGTDKRQMHGRRGMGHAQPAAIPYHNMPMAAQMAQMAQVPGHGTPAVGGMDGYPGGEGQEWAVVWVPVLQPGAAGDYQAPQGKGYGGQGKGSRSNGRRSGSHRRGNGRKGGGGGKGGGTRYAQ